MYCSFKYGEFQGERNGRFFCGLNEDSFRKLLKKTNLEETDLWISQDARKERSHEKWLNVLCRKPD